MSQPVVDGVAHYLLNLFEDQVRRGWHVALACPGGMLGERAAELGVEVRSWDASRAPGRSLGSESTSLRRSVRRFAPDLVHLHSSKAGLVGRLPSVVTGAAVVFQPHAWSFWAAPGPMRPLAITWERLAAPRAALTICGSRAERDGGRSAGLRGPIEVIPNAIAIADFPVAGPVERSRERAMLGLDDRSTVVCVGRLCEQKGQDQLFDAWPAVQRAVPDAVLLLVGDGEHRDRLERRRLPGVRFLGGRSPVWPYFAAADVVVQPSRWETLSLSVLEAMATGRSVVATDASGMHEALLEGAGPPAGAVVPQADTASLAGALVERLQTPVQADREGAAGRSRVLARHTADQLGRRVAASYQRVLDQRASPPHV